MTQVSYPACQPGMVQMRLAQREREWPYLPGRYMDTLWRTAQCDPGRWHWFNNPCKCRNGPPRPLHAFSLPREWVWWPITGTWKRDGQAIASQMQKFRDQLRAIRSQEIAARAAIGPRNVCKPVVFIDGETRSHDEYCPWCRPCPGAVHWCSK